ncbi:DUF3046 domain-containing protein [Brachybacterium nesterenkovii]|uniref:DUF3046 domain-containing protein n=1 Tax=Brachybacterium nesterenkovii TaxID=47847 RepID=A0A1X6X0Q7_9MICO|nr:DUF3046 domain-containing protein [Brachybacterium nesterenkovii]SLM91131.1 hypothetical protein FM110_06170 [Brachybacterium nesterenkovii]
MRRSEFTALSEHVFGPVLARTYTLELGLVPFGGRTAAVALDDGEDVRRVWTALCDEMDVPESRRWEIPPEERRRR